MLSEFLYLILIKHLFLKLFSNIRRVIFRNIQDESRLPENIQSRYYSAINAKDYHIAYYGEILNAYIIE